MMRVSELAEIIGAKVIGNGDLMLSNPERIETASQGGVTFFQNARYKSALLSCKASAVITTSSLVDKALPFTWLIVPDAYSAFALAVSAFYPPKKPSFSCQGSFVHASAQVDSSSQVGAMSYVGENTIIGNNVIIYPQVYIGNGVLIGDGSILYPGVKVMDFCQIGKNCVLHPGVVIGADGFGFAPLPDQTYRKIPQMGKVVLEDDVEIGANTCVDRATLGDTILQKGTKIDNLVQVGHNVIIGEHTVVAAQVGFAGSSKIGHHARIGGQAGFAPHISLAPFAQVNAQSGVSKSVEKEKSILTGSPAAPFIEFYRKQALLNKLESEWKEIRDSLHLLQLSTQKDV